MVVMLLNMKVHILVKIEVLVVSLIPEGLQLGTNGVSGRDNSLSSKEESAQGWVHLLPILGLAKLLHVMPPARLPPARMEDVVNRGHVGQETGLKRPVSLKGLKACRELQVGQVSAQYGGPMAKLVIDQDVRAAWLPKRQRVFGLIIWICIIGSFQTGTRDITEGMSSYSPHLGKENEHVIKGLGCRMRFKGQCRGLRWLGVKETIFKGLLVGQGLNLLVIVEGFSRPLAKEKDSLKHINSGLADPGLEGNSILSQVIVAIFILVLISDGQFVRVLAPVMPSLLTCLEGLKLSARHQHFPLGLGAQSIGISPSPPPRIRYILPLRGSSLVKLDDLSCQSVVQQSLWVNGPWSVPAVMRRSSQCGSDELN